MRSEQSVPPGFRASYLRAAEALLAAGEPASMRLGHDGFTCVYGVTGAQGRAELELGPTGILTLRSFTPEQPSEAVVDT